MEETLAYRALALQARTRSVNGATDRAQARVTMLDSIDRIRVQIESSLRWIGSDTKLVVLPEYVLTGHPVGEPIVVWADRAALEVDGPEYEALGAIARDNAIYLAGSAYELDAAFPDLYFQTSFIISPDGDVVLRYRRLNSMFSPTPHDLLDRYIDVHGADSLFPVVETPIGTLACIASEEILFPEVGRVLALRGAEVFCHSTSEVGSPLVTQKDVAKRARAFENLAYVVSANSGGIDGSPIPGESTDGGSQVVDFAGRVLVQAGQGESMVAYNEVDVAALRRERRRPSMANMVARNRLDLYAGAYADTTVHAPNGWPTEGEAPRSWFADTQREVIARLVRDGIIH